MDKNRISLYALLGVLIIVATVIAVFFLRSSAVEDENLAGGALTTTEQTFLTELRKVATQKGVTLSATEETQALTIYRSMVTGQQKCSTVQQNIAKANQEIATTGLYTPGTGDALNKAVTNCGAIATSVKTTFSGQLTDATREIREGRVTKTQLAGTEPTNDVFADDAANQITGFAWKDLDRAGKVKFVLGAIGTAASCASGNVASCAGGIYGIISALKR